MKGFLKKRGSGVVGTIGKDWRKPSMGTDDGSVRRASAHRPVLPGRPTSRIVSCYTSQEVKASSVKPSADRGSDGCRHVFWRDHSTLLPLVYPNPLFSLTPNLYTNSY